MRPDDRPRNRGREYQRLRRRILDSYGWRCDGCGRAAPLELHHRNGDRTDDRPANLRPLCRRCHHAEHGREHARPDKWAELRAELRRRLVDS